MTQLLKYRNDAAAIEKRTGVRITCPRCHSKRSRWRVRTREFICERCGQTWDAHGNMLPVTPGRK